MLLEEVVAAAREYEKIDASIREIRREANQVRESFAKRLEPLLIRHEDLRRALINYQVENNQPAFRLEDTVFQLEEIPAYLPKDAKIEKILREQTPDTPPDVVTRKIITLLSKRIIVEENDEKRQQFRIRLIRPKANK